MPRMRKYQETIIWGPAAAPFPSGSSPVLVLVFVCNVRLGLLELRPDPHKTQHYKPRCPSPKRYLSHLRRPLRKRHGDGGSESATLPATGGRGKHGRQPPYGAVQFISGRLHDRWSWTMAVNYWRVGASSLHLRRNTTVLSIEARDRRNSGSLGGLVLPHAREAEGGLSQIPETRLP